MKLLVVFLFLISGVALSAIPDHISDREKRKFVGSSSREGFTAVETSTVVRGGQVGSSWFIAPSGQAETAELIRLVGGNFEGTALLPNIWETSFIADASATVILGEAVLLTGTTINASASMQTFNRARFVTATYNKAHMAVATPGFANPSVTRRWGLFDPVRPIKSGDGIYFELKNGLYSIVRKKAGVVVETIPNEDFTSGTIIGTDNIITTEIVYNAGNAYFFANDKVLHRMLYLDAVGYETVHLKLGMQVLNTDGNTTNNQIKTRGFSVSRIGSASAVPDKFIINSAGTALIQSGPGIFRRFIITDTGVGGASVSFFDNEDCVSNPLENFDLTDSLIGLDFGYEFNNALCYVATGANFEATVVFE